MNAAAAVVALATTDLDTAPVAIDPVHADTRLAQQPAVTGEPDEQGHRDFGTGHTAQDEAGEQPDGDQPQAQADAAPQATAALIARVTAAVSLGTPMEVARERLTPSPTNPRRSFGEMDGLAATIAEHGIMSPLLVRPHPTKGEGEYEIVAGERRWRASEMAGLAALPVLVRHLTDAQAAMLQAIENVQRRDLNPMEEAAGYEQLQQRAAENGQPPLTVQEIARLTGKDYRDVLRSIKLLALTAPGRTALLDGKISAPVAFMLARVPAVLQADALKAIANTWNGVPMTEHEARNTLQRSYMTSLKGAVFNITDATLVPAAGACGPCPMRTGNATDLFGDVREESTCTDTKCFAAKTAAHYARVREAAKAKGQRVIEGAEAKALMTSYRPKGYVALDDYCYAVEGHKTYEKLLGKKVRGLVLIEKSDGSLAEYLPEADAREQLAERGHKVGGKLGSMVREEDREKARKAKRETKVRRAAYERIRAADYAPNAEAMLRLAARGLFLNTSYDTRGKIAEAYGWGNTGFGGDGREKAIKAIATMEVPALGRFVQAMMIQPELSVSENHDPGCTALEQAAAMAGVDLAAMRREALAEATAKANKKAGGGTKAKATISAPAPAAVPAKGKAGKGKASATPAVAPATPAATKPGKTVKASKVKAEPVKRASTKGKTKAAPAAVPPAPAAVTPAGAWPFPTKKPAGGVAVVASAPEARSVATPEPVAGVEPVALIVAQADAAPVAEAVAEAVEQVAQVITIEREPLDEARAPEADNFNQDGPEAGFAEAADFDTMAYAAAADADTGYIADSESDD